MVHTFFVDGGGRGCQAMKARAKRDCFLVSVESLASGGRCTSVGQVEAYALPLRAAMVYNAIAKFEQFVAKKSCYRKMAFYDADVANPARGQLNRENKHFLVSVRA